MAVKKKATKKRISVTDRAAPKPRVKKKRKKLELIDVFNPGDLRDLERLYGKTQLFMVKDGQRSCIMRFQIVARLEFVINDLLSWVEIEAKEREES